MQKKVLLLLMLVGTSNLFGMNGAPERAQRRRDRAAARQKAAKLKAEHDALKLIAMQHQIKATQQQAAVMQQLEQTLSDHQKELDGEVMRLRQDLTERIQRADQSWRAADLQKQEIMTKIDEQNTSFNKYLAGFEHVLGGISKSNESLAAAQAKLEREKNGAKEKAGA